MKTIDCPYCNQPGAVKRLFKTRCPNPACPAYDPEMQGGLAAGKMIPGGTDAGVSEPRDGGFARGPEEAARPGETAPLPTHARTRGGVKGTGCGTSIFLWIAAYISFRLSLRYGGPWWIGTVVLAMLAWKHGKVKVEAGRRPTRREEKRVTPDAVIEYVDTFSTAGGRRVEIRYRNWKGERKTFVGDRKTMRRRGRHLSIRVEPAEARIALALDRIENLPDLGVV